MNATFAARKLGDVELRPRDPDGWRPGIAMAVGVHAVLVVALTLGVQWKITTPEVVEAEMWSSIPKAAAPQDVPPPPPRMETPRPVAKVAPPEPKDETPVREKAPDIVVKKEEKKDKKPKVKEREEVMDSTPPRPAKKPRTEPEPKVEKKPEKADKKPEKAPEKPVQAKPVESKVTNPDGTGMTAAERTAQRNAQLQRMMNQLGELGTSASAGPSAAYAGRVAARIKPRIVFTDSVNGNPATVVEVRCAPDGRIMSRKVIEPSGVARWDDAVLRAIDATEVLPLDENGKVPPVMQIRFRPNDL